jgi:hypothetical protein
MTGRRGRLSDRHLARIDRRLERGRVVVEPIALCHARPLRDVNDAGVVRKDDILSPRTCRRRTTA